MLETKAQALERNVLEIHPSKIRDLNDKMDNLNNIL
jgi:hypothetical protein